MTYEVGGLKIRELRERVETELGDQFNFRDVILLNGAVLLFVLEELVGDYIGRVNGS